MHPNLIVHDSACVILYKAIYRLPVVGSKTIACQNLDDFKSGAVAFRTSRKEEQTGEKRLWSSVEASMTASTCSDNQLERYTLTIR